MKPRIWVAFLLAVSLVPAQALLMASDKAEKKELTESYKNKFLVVLREGLAVGSCAQHPAQAEVEGVRMPPPVLTVRVYSDHAEYHPEHGLLAGAIECGEIDPEPIHKGEILRASGAFLHGSQLAIGVENISPHQFRRGAGAFQQETYEVGGAALRFQLDDPRDYDAARKLVANWVKVFDSQDDASKFGNTASGVFVREVKLGMTPAEVEAQFGPPSTRVDLGQKVLYKYKDMTVEFRDGKVVDVR